jgi:predicted ATPase
MRFSRLLIENWRNFRNVDVSLSRRVFIVGPNASGKSNLLDALRFLRDVADPQGGFQRAVAYRRGVSQIRSLHARQYSNVVLDTTLALDDTEWRYRLEFNQDNVRRPTIRKEEVWHEKDKVLSRPDATDEGDPQRLTQTHLEQVNANKDFRAVAEFLAQIRYLHLVPQLVRDRDRYVGRERDPFGGDFLDQLARMQREQKRTFESRMRRITEALRVAVPQLDELKLEADERGVPHLRGLYKHWRPDAGWQNEDQFSDGTLRLMGLLWALLDGTAPILLEEPELSLHAAVIRYIPTMMWRLGRKTGRQTIVSTHSADLLNDESIAPEEVLLLEPSKEGTEVSVAASHHQTKTLLSSGLPIGEVVLPRTAPKGAEQLALLFGD